MAPRARPAPAGRAVRITEPVEDSRASLTASTSPVRTGSSVLDRRIEMTCSFRQIRTGEAAFAAHLHADLDGARRSETVRLVTEKLLASTWLRALAPGDPAAPISNWPDHGAAGAFCAWPGVTACGLAKLGRADLAARLLSVVHESASGGLWGQAMEIVADSRGDWVRVAEDGVSNRDSIGVAIAEAVVSGLFVFEPSFGDLQTTPLPDSIDIPGIGSLSNINVGPRVRLDGRESSRRSGERD
jgi:hypothetical protein